MRPVWVGSSAPTLAQLAGGEVHRISPAGRPTFLAVHPTRPRLYAVAESDPGAVEVYAVQSWDEVERTARVGSGGSAPCHLLVHPEGGWLYVSNYGDGVVTALRLDERGDVTDERVELPHHGHGPRTDRQEGPHAHSAAISGGGGWLVVADLGTDELRGYRLDDGRPDPVAVTTALPPGTGPRHVAVDGEAIHVAGELSGDVLTVAWDERAGRGELVGAVRAVTLPPRTGDEHALSHLELVGERLLIGVRGADTVAVVGVERGVVSALLAEIPTVAWPRHLLVVDDAVLVAGERADRIGVHPLAEDDHGQPVVGELAAEIVAQAPMCLVAAGTNVAAAELPDAAD